MFLHILTATFAFYVKFKNEMDNEGSANLIEATKFRRGDKENGFVMNATVITNNCQLINNVDKSSILADNIRLMRTVISPNNFECPGILWTQRLKRQAEALLSDDRMNDIVSSSSVSTTNYSIHKICQPNQHSSLDSVYDNSKLELNVDNCLAKMEIPISIINDDCTPNISGKNGNSSAGLFLMNNQDSKNLGNSSEKEAIAELNCKKIGNFTSNRPSVTSLEIISLPNEKLKAKSQFDCALNTVLQINDEVNNASLWDKKSNAISQLSTNSNIVPRLNDTSQDMMHVTQLNDNLKTAPQLYSNLNTTSQFNDNIIALCELKYTAPLLHEYLTTASQVNDNNRDTSQLSDGKNIASLTNNMNATSHLNDVMNATSQLNDNMNTTFQLNDKMKIVSQLTDCLNSTSQLSDCPTFNDHKHISRNDNENFEAHLTISNDMYKSSTPLRSGSTTSNDKENSNKNSHNYETNQNEISNIVLDTNENICDLSSKADACVKPIANDDIEKGINDFSPLTSLVLSDNANSSVHQPLICQNECITLMSNLSSTSNDLTSDQLKNDNWNSAYNQAGSGNLDSFSSNNSNLHLCCFNYSIDKVHNGDLHRDGSSYESSDNDFYVLKSGYDKNQMRFRSSYQISSKFDSSNKAEDYNCNKDKRDENYCCDENKRGNDTSYNINSSYSYDYNDLIDGKDQVNGNDQMIGDQMDDDDQMGGDLVDGDDQLDNTSEDQDCCKLYSNIARSNNKKLGEKQRLNLDCHLHQPQKANYVYNHGTNLEPRYLNCCI